jgi:hypothetical protein
MQYLFLKLFAHVHSSIYKYTNTKYTNALMMTSLHCCAYAASWLDSSSEYNRLRDIDSINPTSCCTKLSFWSTFQCECITYRADYDNLAPALMELCIINYAHPVMRYRCVNLPHYLQCVRVWDHDMFSMHSIMSNTKSLHIYLSNLSLCINRVNYAVLTGYVAGYYGINSDKLLYYSRQLEILKLKNNTYKTPCHYYPLAIKELSCLYYHGHYRNDFCYDNLPIYMIMPSTSFLIGLPHTNILHLQNINICNNRCRFGLLLDLPMKYDNMQDAYQYDQFRRNFPQHVNKHYIANTIKPKTNMLCNLL